MGSRGFPLWILQNICGTSGFYVINLLIFDRNPSVTFPWCKPLKKSYENYKFLATASVIKKEFCNSVSIITLYCVRGFILYSVYL